MGKNYGIYNLTHAKTFNNYLTLNNENFIINLNSRGEII